MEKRLKEAIVYTPDISKAVPIRMSDDWKEEQYIANANGHVNVCHFSDTFIIYVHYLCRREAYWLVTPKYEPFLYCWEKKILPIVPFFIKNIKSIYRSYRLVWTFFANQLLRGFLCVVAFLLASH